MAKHRAKAIERGITKLPNGKYRVRIYRLGTPFHGGYFDTLVEAQSMLQELRDSVVTLRQQVFQHQTYLSNLLDWFIYRPIDEPVLQLMKTRE